MHLEGKEIIHTNKNVELGGASKLSGRADHTVWIGRKSHWLCMSVKREHKADCREGIAYSSALVTVSTREKGSLVRYKRNRHKNVTVLVHELVKAAASWTHTSHITGRDISGV